MKDLELSTSQNFPALFERCKGYPGETHSLISKFKFVQQDHLYSRIQTLRLPGNAFPGILDEIIELIYLDNCKCLHKTRSYRINEMMSYLNATGFQIEGYSSKEFMSLMRPVEVEKNFLIDLGSASTDPRILELLHYVSSNSTCRFEKIKPRVVDRITDIIKALQKGASHRLITEILARDNYGFWVIEAFPFVVESEKIGVLFLDLSDNYGGLIRGKFERSFQIVDRQTLSQLADLQDRELALVKLSLMSHFPEFAQCIYNFDPVSAFKSIITRKLTDWRHEIAERINWESEHLKSITFSGNDFNLKDYYDGYRENFLFDAFIRAIVENRACFRDVFVGKKSSKKFLSNYKRMVVMNEYQGTIYSILQDEHGFSWGPVNPKSTVINVEFENEISHRISTRFRGFYLKFTWFKLAYLESVLGVTYSRLSFYPEATLDDFILGSMRANLSEENLINIRKFYSGLDSYCQPRRVSSLRLAAPKTTNDIKILFGAIWRESIDNSDPRKSYREIVRHLEGGTNFLAQRVLLIILQEVIKRHFSEGAVKNIDFTVFSPELNSQIELVLGDE